MDEIIEVYEKQLSLYRSIKVQLLEMKDTGSGQKDFDIKLKDISCTLESISKVNRRAEQLKQIYTLKHRLDDFTGEQIKRVESPDNYKRLKNVVDSLTDEIRVVKKLQDEVINRINREAEDTWHKLKEINNNRKHFDNYDKSYKSKHENLIDFKK